MTRHPHHKRHDERGMSLVIVGMGMMAFMAAGMLAVDVGMLMTSRAQAQNAADAGAFAGAIALAYNDYNDRSASGPAVTGAIAAAKANTVMHQEVSVTPADVEFPTDPSGQPNRVTVTVRRTAERGNPLSTFMASMFGHASVDIGATATAESVKANAESCVKPWAIPDKWDESRHAALGYQRHVHRVPDEPLGVPGHLSQRHPDELQRVQARERRGCGSG